MKLKLISCVLAASMCLMGAALPDAPTVEDASTPTSSVAESNSIPDEPSSDMSSLPQADESKDSWGGNRNTEFVVDRAHPGLMDLFTTQARHDYLLTQPLTKEDIQHEAACILSRLQEPQKPNSPNETHFMAQISQDFLLRASSKDQDKLFSMLPFASLTFSGMKDRKGLFATVSKEENRSQPLRKPSVRKKLEQTPEGQPKTPVPKKRGVER